MRSVNTDLQRERDEYKQQVDEFKDTLDDLDYYKQTSEDLENEKTRLLEDNRNLEDQTHLLQSQLSQTQSTNEKLQEAISELRNQENSRNQFIGSLQQEIMEKNNSIASYDQVIEQYKREIQNKDQRIGFLEQNNREQQENNNQLNAEMNKVTVLLSQKENELNRLQENSSMNEHALGNANDQIHSLQQSNTMLSNKVDGVVKKASSMYLAIKQLLPDYQHGLLFESVFLFLLFHNIFNFKFIFSCLLQDKYSNKGKRRSVKPGFFFF